MTAVMSQSPVSNSDKMITTDGLRVHSISSVSVPTGSPISNSTDHNITIFNPENDRMITTQFIVEDSDSSSSLFGHATKLSDTNGQTLGNDGNNENSQM